jgi:hypothetical protein
MELAYSEIFETFTLDPFDNSVCIVRFFSHLVQPGIILLSWRDGR